MTLPVASHFQFTSDLAICPILNGMWQVSGAHGAIDPARAVEAMFAYHDAGFTTWDLADHYGPAEDFIGAFRREFAARYGEARLAEIQAFTKWVPLPARMTPRTVENAMAFHWRAWVSNASICCSSIGGITPMRAISTRWIISPLQQEGKIRHLGLTNFDTERLRAIADHGVRHRPFIPERRRHGHGVERLDRSREPARLRQSRSAASGAFGREHGHRRQVAR